MADVEILQKLLRETEAVTADLDPTEITEHARARARAESLDAADALTQLIELYADRDWTAPPSVRRHLGAALVFYGNSDALPEATRSAAAPDSLARALHSKLGVELDSYARFSAQRTRLERKRLTPPARERALYRFRQKLRARLQANGK